jgi:hypothetical protein
VEYHSKIRLAPNLHYGPPLHGEMVEETITI